MPNLQIEPEPKTLTKSHGMHRGHEHKMTWMTVTHDTVQASHDSHDKGLSSTSPEVRSAEIHVSTAGGLQPR